MRIDVPMTRRRRIPLTSLIDVIFMLLLFFILSTTFTRFAEIELSGGEAGAGTTGAPDILVRLDEAGWTVNGLGADAQAAIAELRRLEQSGAASAVLIVRGEASSQDLVVAVERIRRETGLALNVAR